MTTTKITKKDFYNAIIALAKGNAIDIAADDIVAFANKEIAALERKAAKAKETAAKKKSEDDPIMAAVLEVLEANDDYLTIPAVTAAINVEDYTTSKVQYRLNALVKAEQAETADIKVDKRTVKGFKLIRA